MKCDILIHLPSGIAYTGRAEEDKFIGSTAYLLQSHVLKLASRPKEGERRKTSIEYELPPTMSSLWRYYRFIEKGREGLEATLGPDALILTWKVKKEIETERIRCSDMASALVVDVTPEESRATRIASAALGAGLIGAVVAATGTLHSFPLLRIETKGRDYAMFIPQAADWVDRLGEQGVNTGRTDGFLPDNPEEQ